MLKESPAFSGFSVNNQAAAKQFYAEALGLNVSEDSLGLTLLFDNGVKVFIYEKPDHTPATFTVLNFPVDNIDATIDELANKGVIFEHYESGILPAEQDAKGVLRGKAAGMGPDIAWFKDPAGNVLSVLTN